MMLIFYEISTSALLLQLACRTLSRLLEVRKVLDVSYGAIALTGWTTTSTSAGNYSAYIWISQI